MPEWSSRRPEAGAEAYILVRVRVHEDEGHFVGECLELGVSSFGDTVDEAIRMTLEAIEVHLDALEELGERDRVFAENGIFVYSVEPSEDVTVPVMTHPGDTVSTQRLALAAY